MGEADHACEDVRRNTHYIQFGRSHLPPVLVLPTCFQLLNQIFQPLEFFDLLAEPVRGFFFTEK